MRIRSSTVVMAAFLLVGESDLGAAAVALGDGMADPARREAGADRGEPVSRAGRVPQVVDRETLLVPDDEGGVQREMGAAEDRPHRRGPAVGNQPVRDL